MLYWVKSDPRPRFSGQCAYGMEPVVVSGSLQPVGGCDYFVASAPRMNRDNDATGHSTQKPVELMEWLLALTVPSGGRVLDPFCGSGSTLVSAACLGMDAVGIELDPHWCEVARQRIAHLTSPEHAMRQAGSLFAETEVNAE